MRRFIAISIILFFAFLASLTFSLWQTHRTKPLTTANDEAADLERVKLLLDKKEPLQALEIIQHYHSQIEDKEEKAAEWLSMMIEASVMTHDLPQLIVLYHYSPEAFDDHEKATLLIANQLINHSQTEEYLTLRQRWLGHEKQDSAWYILDVDRLLLDGQIQDAKIKLKSRTFEGAQDTDRLVRLALLIAMEEPQEALQYLTQAREKSPANADIRLYLAQLLEEMHRSNLAHIEYLASVQLAPKNSYYLDQLAEYYIRTRRYSDAINTWKKGISPPSRDFIWTKLLFWGKVVKPLDLSEKMYEKPFGKFRAFNDYLMQLERTYFWDNENFKKVPNGPEIIRERQEARWLLVLNALQNSREADALELLLRPQTDEDSFDPALELALLRTLNYRLNGSLVFIGHEELLNDHRKQLQSPSLFLQIEFAANETDDSEQDPELFALLKSPEAFVALFLAAGWNDAALQLQDLFDLSPSLPDWMAVELTKAFKQNRQPQDALEFTQTQEYPSDKLRLLIAELELGMNHQEIALTHLSELSRQRTTTGSEAALMLAKHLIEEKKYDEAQLTIEKNPHLIEEISGQETLAHIALLKGDKAKAEQLFQGLEESSAEAKSFLARQAFKMKNWARAKQLTEQLLAIYPENELLHQNLAKVIEAQQKEKQQDN